MRATAGAGVRARRPAWRWWNVLLPLLFLPPACAFGADKNGVAPSAISLPKGPGAIEGLGESFQPRLNTGTAAYGINLSVPAGTAGRQPSLKLSYEGGGGNGVLGYGWSLPLPMIQRRTDHGIPLYGRDLGLDRPDCFINESKEELVPQADGYYFCENEGAFVRYRQVTNHWEGTAPDGTRLEFGLTANGRVEDSASGHVFSWLLERETDTRGNTILYTYRTFPGSQNAQATFLGTVTYGPGAPPWQNFHFVVFEYEDRPDWFEDCRPGFPVRCGKRINRIVMGTQGPSLPGHLAGDWNGDGQPDFLNRQYELSYVNYAGADTHWSLLGRVQVVGADGSSRLPATTLGYSVCDPPDSLSAAGKVIGGLNEPAAVVDNEFVELADLNGDGLPDILRTFGGGLPHQAFLNQGVKKGTQSLSWQMAREVGGDARAWNVNLQSAAGVAHLADMDGDGLADLALKSLTDEVYFFRNRGDLSWGSRQLMSVEDVAPPSPFGQPGVRAADLDFDKRIDIVQSLSAGGGFAYRIWLNLGDGRYASSMTVTPVEAFDLADPLVQIADFNGDRVPDLVRVQSDHLLVKAGLGYGQFLDAVTVPLPNFTLNSDQLRQAKLTDVTGDGLADLLIERAAPGQLWYWINHGNYQLGGKKEIAGMPLTIGPGAVVRWADMNGNGSTDLIYADSTSDPRLQTVDLGEIINCGANPNILDSIANGMGRTITIAYRSSIDFRLEDEAAGRPWPYLLPFAVPVVAGVRINDSLGHEYLTEYHYHDGYYDPVQKQFRGFARVEQVEVGDATAPTLISRSFFDTGSTYESMKGKLLRQMTEEEDGRVYWDETTTWTVPPLVLKTGTNGHTVRFVHPLVRSRSVQELGQGTERILETESDYDEFGNQTFSANYGIVEEGDRTAENDERLTRTDYALNTAKWIVRLPKRTETMDEQGAVISRTEFYYDDETFSGSNLGQVAIGNLTLQRDWIDPAGATAFVRSARTQYDAYGNAAVLLNPLAVASGGTVDLARGHVRSVTYDSRFHSYPVVETIQVGGGRPSLVFRATYDEDFGTVMTATDFNANRTAYTYDPFARLTAIIKPGDTPQYPTSEYQHVLAVPVGTQGLVNYVETRLLDQAPGSRPQKLDHYLISREFMDGLGRQLMTKQEAASDPATSSPAVVVNGAVTFNARTGVASVLNPFFSMAGTSLDGLLDYENIEAPGWKGTFDAQGTRVNLGLAQAHKTSTSYDATLRETGSVYPDGTFDKTVYEPLTTRSFDANQSDPASPYFGASVAHFGDGLGRLARVDEVVRLSDDGTPGSAPATWTTLYQYNLNDQLTRITDAQNNVKRMSYDGLMRKTSTDDPDRGLTSLRYDEASNLIETTDAKGRKITYTYDGVNRLLTEDYEEDTPRFPKFDSSRAVTPANRPAVAYFYDLPITGLEMGDGTTFTATNTAGLLAYVWDLTGEEHYNYDAREHAAAVIKRVNDPLTGLLVSYRTGYTFDSLDRLTSVLYPDNDVVRYEYDERGLGRRILGGPTGSIVANMLYSPAGQLTFIEYGNGVQTRNNYDVRLRLQQLRTDQPQLGVQHIGLAYQFDAVSNLKAITDTRPASSVPDGEPRRNTQSAEYDDLYRLTRIQYSFATPGAAPRNDGEIRYRYDRIGNMLSQTSTIEHYENGLSMTRLGAMSYGGSSGPANRIGRAAADPPGPHALTSVSQLSTNHPQPRLFSYDANGNMLDLDGLKATWDIKDRLIAVENSEMKADYAYDHRDRRITKKVVATATAAPAGAQIDSTIYVDQYFEFRHNSAPVKYVWSGNTRVARVTGMLSSNQRLQRFRLWTGWNLCSMGVTADRAGEQLALGQAVRTVLRWDPAQSVFKTVSLTETLPAGTVLWLEAVTNATVVIRGPAAQTTPPSSAPVQGTFHPGDGSQILELERFAPVNAAVWRFDAATQRWAVRLTDALAGLSDLPASLAPGEGVFIRADTGITLSLPDAALNIRYYHHDHLGSSTVVTDSNGVTVEESAFYPFGYPRHTETPLSAADPYQFTQKERDRESGLNCLEARFQSPLLGRFLRVDPLAGGMKSSWLDDPQRLNLYAYCGNSPLGNLDPNGADFMSTMKGFGIGVLEGGGGSILSMANPLNAVMLPAHATVAVAKGIYSGGVQCVQAATAVSHADYEGAATAAFPTISKLLDPKTSDEQAGRMVGNATGKALVAVAANKALGAARAAASPAAPPANVTVGRPMSVAGQTAPTQPALSAPKTLRDPTLPTGPAGEYGLERLAGKRFGLADRTKWLQRNTEMGEMYSEEVQRRLKVARPAMDEMIEQTGSAKPILNKIFQDVEELYGNWD